MGFGPPEGAACSSPFANSHRLAARVWSDPTEGIEIQGETRQEYNLTFFSPSNFDHTRLEEPGNQHVCARVWRLK